MYSYSLQEISLLAISVSLLLAGLILVFREHNIAGLISFFAGSIGMALFTALLVPYLQVWDEQFHACVARNMASNPLIPRLFPHNPIYSDYTDWGYSYIWLHKQPFFLWLMSLSIKLFGVNVLAVRLPSILLHGVLSLLCYRTGSLLFDKKTAAIATVFISLAQYPLGLISGAYATDHNDFIFLFLVSASLWAFTEYQHSNKLKYVILIGVFSGFAILTKWLSGLLVFSGWGMILLIFRTERLSVQKWKDLILAGLIAVAISLPWQLYVLLKFPIESNFEYAFNSRHFFEVIENHGGDVWYHYDALFMLYGKPDIIPWLIMISLGWMIHSIPNKKTGTALLINVGIIYLFFTLAKTKMEAFCLPVMMIIFISIANVLVQIIHLIPDKLPYRKHFCTLFLVISVGGLSYIFLNFDLITEKHRSKEKGLVIWRKTLTDQERFILTNKEILSQDSTIIYCDWPKGNIRLMFYTGNEAHNFIPQDWELINTSKKGGKAIIITRTPHPYSNKNLKGLHFLQYNFSIP